MSKTKVPKSFQGFLWSVRVNNLDIDKDKVYIINQLLAYGTFKEWRWLFKTYPLSTLRRIFINKPLKIYHPSIFNFVKNIVLGLKEVNLSPFKYDKNLPRIIRQK